MGLPVTVGLPGAIDKMMALYPQHIANRPTVQYLPLPYDRRTPLPKNPGKQALGR